MSIFKKIIKKFFNGLGYNIARTNSQPRDGVFTPFRVSSDAELTHIKRLGFTPSLIIDAGAANGQSPFLHFFPNAEYLWIEPCEEFAPHLQELQKKYNGKYYIAAAGDTNSESRIFVYEGLYGSSLFTTTDQKYVKSNERTVPVIRVDSVVSPTDYPKGGIILKADVQGFELNVLRGAEGILDKVDLIFLETCLFDTFEGGADLTEIILYLQTKGFKPYAFVDGSNRPFDQALFQVDVFFVRENGFFRKSNPWASDEQYTGIFQNK